MIIKSVRDEIGRRISNLVQANVVDITDEDEVIKGQMSFECEKENGNILIKLGGI